MNFEKDFKNLITTVSSALGEEISMTHIKIIDEGIPHKHPKKLPLNCSAVYTFYYPKENIFLKIGKVGKNNNPRYISQHYGFKVNSTLAKSIIMDPEINDGSITRENVKDWIFNNFQRVDIILDETLGLFALDLIESSLHYVYKPKYEGYASQKH